MALKKEIEISGIRVKLKASADTPRVYRHLFGKDLFQDMNMLNLNVTAGSLDMGNTEVLENIAYTMASQADRDIPDIDEWLDQFEVFDIYLAIKDILSLWAANISTMSKNKKK